MNPILIIAAPSGSGKTTIVRRLLQEMDDLVFSISATTRAPRENEKDGVDYYFLSEDKFEEMIKDGKFLEWEMVYKGKYYGTLRSEIDQIFSSGKIPILDIDVVGAVKLKSLLGNRAFTIFIKPPSIAVLEERLRNRGSDSESVIKERIAKAERELKYENRFDCVVVNNNLDDAVTDAKNVIDSVIGNQ